MRRPKALICAACCILFTFTDSLALTKRDILNKKCYSISDLYQLGVLSFYEEAKSRGDTFIKMIKKMQDSTGRLRISYPSQRGMELGGGTIVFLPKDYILTAGHNVSEIKQGDSTKNIEVITADRETFKAEVVVSSIKKGDWAVLKLLKSYKGPTASIGNYKQGDEAIVMGYPMSLAHDENYKVQFYDVAISPDPNVQKMILSQRNLSKNSSMYSIPLMGKIVEDKIVLSVGTDILSGSSGSPAFNLEGELMGIVSSSVVMPSFTFFIGGKGKIEKFFRFYPAEKIIEKCPELADALGK